MEKILSTLIALILSANTYTIVHTDSHNEEERTNSITSSDIQEKIEVEEISPIRGVTPTTSTSTAWWSYPSNIMETTRNGDDLLVLVNKQYKLPSNYAPSDLVNICETVTNLRCVHHSNHLLRSIVVDDLQDLVNDAASDGIDLSVRSAYRSYNTQVATYNHWLSVNGGNVAATDRVSARAGHSQHQLGTTIDFSTSEINDGLGGTFATTQASRWLAENAIKYGFALSYPQGYESTTGYSYESWHYRYIGKEYAQDMVSSGMILELYLRSKN